MNRNERRGFTIVELLMVIGIISVLIGITISAVSGSLKRGREQKAKAICTLVEQGIATYYAQRDKWPGGFNPDSKSEDNDSDVYTLTSSEVQAMVLDLVKQTQDGNPVMDVSGLYVANKSGGSNRYGMDFTAAVKGTKRNPEGIRLSQMEFGYPDADSGKFRQFRMYYAPATDRITVSR